MSLILRPIFEHGRRTAETALLLRVFQSHINRQDCDFNIPEETQQLLWCYYRLQKNFRKSSFWKKDRLNISENEYCFYRLMDTYNQIEHQLNYRFTRREKMMMQVMLERFHNRPLTIVQTKFSERCSNKEL